MKEKKRFLVDVGIRDLPFPMKVISRENTDGQQTIANIVVKNIQRRVNNQRRK